ncbi:MAG TPA: DUF1801 domain-containing protein [Clostridiales bacterium]|nr:DUF1801 domain-containing protein [Clostridiales bacterium]
MSEVKTKPTNQDVNEFLMSIEPEKKRLDCIELKKVFDSVLDEEPALWNNNMIGYGTYHYKSERSKQEGDWPLIAFSPREQNIVIYLMPGVNKYKHLLDKLGKHKVSSGSCLYINKIEDINLDVLKELISTSVADMKKMYNVE